VGEGPGERLSHRKNAYLTKQKAIALLLTLVIATTGGLIARALHVPLGLLLGSLITVGTLAATNRRVMGHAMYLPPRLRMCFVPIIGIAIGGAFTPDILQQAAAWWPSLLALLIYLPLLHWIGYHIYKRAGISPQTAFYGAVPGGLIESVTLGEAAGADVQTLVMLQFLRLILTIVTVPFAFLLLTGHSVGSASGAMLPGTAPDLSDTLVLTIAAALGAGLGYALRLPGWIITGPILMSAAAHAMALTDAVPPAWLINAVQVIVGAGLGARFTGMQGRAMLVVAGVAILNGMLALALALLAATLLAPLTGEPIAAVFLAYAPGGVAEMSLIALSLQMSVVYVAAHHIARIIFAVGFAQLAGLRR
jgi:uncharacterized protein